MTRWRKLRAVILHDSEPLMQLQHVAWQLCSASQAVEVSSAAHKLRLMRSRMTRKNVQSCQLLNAICFAHQLN